MKSNEMHDRLNEATTSILNYITNNPRVLFLPFAILVGAAASIEYTRQDAHARLIDEVDKAYGNVKCLKMDGGRVVGAAINGSKLSSCNEHAIDVLGGARVAWVSANSQRAKNSPVCAIFQKIDEGTDTICAISTRYAGSFPYNMGFE